MSAGLQIAFLISNTKRQKKYSLHAQQFLLSSQLFEKNFWLSVLLNPTLACPAGAPSSHTQRRVSHARLRAVSATLHSLAKFCARSISFPYCAASCCRGGAGTAPLLVLAPRPSVPKAACIFKSRGYQHLVPGVERGGGCSSAAHPMVLA